MAKRLTDTDKWKDDWYISLSNDYRIIWQWLLDNCNHAGVCKRSIALLNRDCNTSIIEDELMAVLAGRLIAKDTLWFIPKFIKFQYNGLNNKRPVTLSVIKELEKTGFASMIPQSFGNDYLIIKDKSKDKDIIVLGTSENTDPRGDENSAVVLIDEATQCPITINPNRPKDAPTWDQVAWYFDYYVKKRELAAGFFTHYEGNAWTDKYGKPIAHWQSKANGWASNEKPKPPPSKQRVSTYVPTRKDFNNEAEWEEHLASEAKKQQAA